MSLNSSSRYILKFLEDLDTALSLSVAIRFRHGDIAGILSVKIDARSYLSADLYLLDAQALALFSKRSDLAVPGIDKRLAALTKWWDAERSCYRSNNRLSQFHYPGNPLDNDDLRVREFISRTRKKIREWIGDRPPSLDSVQGRFGPGSTYRDRGRLTTVPDKMSSKPTLTPGAFWYILPFLQTKWGRVSQMRGSGLDWVRGNRFLTVPKNALTDRAIAVEPAINVFYQLALGTSLRNRLKANTGWDLSNAADIHRRIARESSSSGEYATIDLSNASDSVCKEIVSLLMPPAWYEELNALRSPFTYVDGKWVRLEKFSSMGNGFTFELETLIFAALLSTFLEKSGASGVLGYDLFVFGDDIIIPDNLAQGAIAMLRFFGFSTNESKSFFGGAGFRESCGEDAIFGVSVRPIFLKDPVNEPEALFPWINRVYHFFEKLRNLGCSRTSYSYDYLIGSLPVRLRACRGPEFLGDCVICDVPEKWRFRWKHGIRYFRAITVVPSYLSWNHWDSEVVLASALYGSGDGLRGVIPRDPPFSYRLTWVPGS